MNSLRRILPEIDIDESPIPSDTLNKIVVTDEDFKNALKEVSPSAIREFQIQKPSIQLAVVGGLNDIQQELFEMIERQLKYPELCDYGGIRPRKGSYYMAHQEQERFCLLYFWQQIPNLIS